MTDYLTPGVYLQDVSPPPVPSFLTGVPAFLGRAAGGPRTPQRFTLWPQFEATFGSPGGFLADAVRGFFGNDGALCYVVRLDENGPVGEALRRGLAALDDVEGVDLICAPDVMSGATWPTGSRVETVTDLQRLLVRHCHDRGDRFAILDAVPAADPAVVVAQRKALAGEAAGTYGALYHPWLWVRDGDRAPRYVPPCGHLAGIYSRSDRRIGVHKAPANEVVHGVLDLQASLTGNEVGMLYASGVNCVRAFPGRGIRVWGARTLGTDPASRDVNARRLVGTISRWIERFMAGLVHEPNDVRLWVRIMRELTAYLDELFQRGALKGRTAEEAFFVKCDDETNPSSVIEAGMVVTQVGVAPTVPAEFIIVRAIHGASGVTVRSA